MSGLMTRTVDKMNPVLGYFYGWIRTYDTSFLFGAIWRKGGCTLICNVGKMTLPQIRSPIYLI